MAGQTVPVGEVPSPVLVVASGVVQDASPAAAALVGSDPNELVGRPLAELVAPADRVRLDGVLGQAVLAQGGPGPGEVAVRLASGAPVGLTATGGSDGRILVALRDLATERRLGAVIDAVADSTLLLDPDGRLLWQSDALAAHVPGARPTWAPTRWSASTPRICPWCSRPSPIWPVGPPAA